MKTRYALCLLTPLLFAAMSLPALFADSLPSTPSPPKNPNAVPIIIRGDTNARTNRLVIPRKFLRESGKTSATTSEKTRMIVAGIAISLAAVALVFLLLRKKSPAAKAAAGVVMFGVTGFLITEVATADIAPPISQIPKTWRRLAGEKQNVVIEIADEGDSVELILGTYRQSRRRRYSREKSDVPRRGPTDGSAEKTGAIRPKK